MPFLSNPTRVDYETQPSFRTLDELLYRYPANGANDILLPAGNKYIFDAKVFDLGVYTLVPQGELSMAFTTESGELTSSKVSGALIRSEHTLYLDTMKFSTTGATYCLEVDGLTGFESVDFLNVQFIGGNIGRLNNIRQVFGSTCFALNTTTGFLIQGNMSGGFAFFNTKGMNISEYFVKADIGVTIGQIRSNANIECLAGCTIFDIDYANITQDEGYNIEGAVLSGAGIAHKPFTGGDTANPEDSRKSAFKGNTGNLAKNTVVGGAWNLTTAIQTPLTQNTPAKILGTTTYLSLSHFTQSNSNEFIYNSSVTKPFRLTGSLTFDGSPNRDLVLEVVKYVGGTIRTVVDSFNQSVNNLQGVIDVAYFNFKSLPFSLSETDTVILEITNTTDNTNITSIVGGRVYIESL